jgi:site-specific recombinase XerD
MKPQLCLVKGFGMSSQDLPPSGLDEAISLYLTAKKALDKGTQANYRRVLRFYKNVSPQYPPTAEGIIAFIVHCQETLKASTVHSYWTMVKGFIKFLVKKRLIVDPLEGISPPPKPDELPRSPPASQVERLIEHLEIEVERLLAKRQKSAQGWRKVRNLALYSLIVDTGLRINEALSIQMEDISLDNHTVFVRNPKGYQTRFVVFGKRVRADLKLWFEYRSRALAHDSPLVFFTTWGKAVRQMGTSNAEHNLERICARLRIPALNPHDLRHFYAVAALENGASPEDVRKQLGHSSLETTSRYAKSRDERRLELHLKSSPRDRLF